MKKKNFKIFFVFLVILFLFEAVHVYSSIGQGFGGKIIKTKATEIENLENQNYECMVLGSTIEIEPVLGKYPHSYMIPSAIKSKTEYPLSAGQSIIGTYSGKTTIICIYRGWPIRIATVILDTITLFGTSQK
jgi:hypothetical protein